MPRTVSAAARTALRTASLKECGELPTISLIRTTAPGTWSWCSDIAPPPDITGATSRLVHPAPVHHTGHPGPTPASRKPSTGQLTGSDADVARLRSGAGSGPSRRGTDRQVALTWA